MDNSRDLNMDRIVSEVKAEYEDIAARSRSEAEGWHKSKVRKPIIKAKEITSLNPTIVRHQLDRITTEADQHGESMRGAKAQISELRRLIARLQNETQAVKTQVSGKKVYSALDSEKRGNRLLLKSFLKTPSTPASRAR